MSVLLHKEYIHTLKFIDTYSTCRRLMLAMIYELYGI